MGPDPPIVSAGKASMLTDAMSFTHVNTLYLVALVVGAHGMRGKQILIKTARSHYDEASNRTSSLNLSPNSSHPKTSEIITTTFQ